MEESVRQPAQLAPRQQMQRPRPRVPPPPPPPRPLAVDSPTPSSSVGRMRSPPQSQQSHQQRSSMAARSAQSVSPPYWKSAANVSMDDVLLYRSWAIHWMSRLYHFHRQELSEYAHDLVKFLRDEALQAFKKEFGYKVSIRQTEEFVAFEIREDREMYNTTVEQQEYVNSSRNRGMNDPQDLTRSGRLAGSGFTFGKWDPSSASSSARTRTATDESKDADGPVRERKGGIVLYFPSSEEDELELQRRRSSLSSTQRGLKEPQYVVLLRGNDELMGWTCSWLQRRFQCVVSRQAVRISPTNLKWLARNWVVDSLGTRAQESQECSDDKPKSPLLLKYRNPDEQSLLRKYTLTVPWVTLMRLYEQSKQQPKKGGPSLIPEVIDMTEQLYFESLPLKMSSFELESFDMTDVSIDQSGHIEFFNMSLVHSLLHGLAELLTLQNTPGPSKPVITL